MKYWQNDHLATAVKISHQHQCAEAKRAQQ